MPEKKEVKPTIPQKDNFEKREDKARNFERADSAASSLIKKGQDSGAFSTKENKKKDS
jgi:hypothetical protein